MSKKLDLEKVNLILDELYREYEGTGHTFVTLEVQDPFIFIPGSDPERELDLWRQTGELAAERLNAAFDHTPLSFSCEVADRLHKPVVEYRESLTEDLSVTDWRVVCDCGCRYVGLWNGALGPPVGYARIALGCEPDVCRDAWRLVSWDHDEPNHDGVGIEL